LGTTVLLAFALLSISSSAAEFDLGPSFKKKLNQSSKVLTFIQVWNASCEPCGEEVSELNHFQKFINDQKYSAQVVGASVASRNAERKAFLEFFRPQYNQWETDEIFNEKILKIGKVPLILLFDKQKQRVVRFWKGKVSSGELIGALKTFNDGGSK